MWILEKLLTQFSRNFFGAWFDIAGKGCEEISVPPWKEVIKMRDVEGQEHIPIEVAILAAFLSLL
ncbi:hypothetical protein [Paenibacillus sp. FSL K6-0108]|uniref:hypothetical protein n=1 Tax=Paenibacillus sp. FSL K6-0108 TaxID=2921417 RepID=UPI0032521090